MEARVSILVIEDEKNICDFVVTNLKTENYKVSTAKTGEEGLSLIASNCPDIVLLDLGLPDIDGIEVIKKVRKWSSVPIIVISARTREDEKVLALDSGADDYITKPFGKSELMARVRTELRHSNRLNTQTNIFHRPYEADGLVIDVEKHRITVNKQEVHMTQIEFKILALLAQNAGRIMTYDSIIATVWGPYAEENNRILRVNMANIRRKIEENPGEPHYIFTELGIGYRMLEENVLNNERNEE